MSGPRCRYAVLHHTGVAAPHFDLVFETEPDATLLTTFRCPAWPLTQDDELEEVADHRRVYLDYEGPISGDRGRVDQVDAGTVQVVDLAVDPPTIALTFTSAKARARVEVPLRVEVLLIEVGATTRWTVASSRTLRQ